jgi:hypothetical protein
MSFLNVLEKNDAKLILFENILFANTIIFLLNLAKMTYNVFNGGYFD